jgi:hypothetical protein
MLNPDELTDNIDAYLNGSLSDDDRKVFENLIQTQSFVKEQLALQKVVRESMEKSAKKATKQLFQNWHQEMQTEPSVIQTVHHNTVKFTTQQTNFRMYKWLAIAASITLFLLTGIFVAQKDSKDSFADSKSFIKVEYEEQNVDMYGYANTENKGGDYKYIMLLPTNTYTKPHYEFVHRDTLVLFSNDLKAEKDQFKILYDGQTNKYELFINGTKHQIEYGFRGVKALE